MNTESVTTAGNGIGVTELDGGGNILYPMADGVTIRDMTIKNCTQGVRFENAGGTIDGTSVYPREVVKEALAVNAAAVILAHNHPSGVAEPSQADERITKRLKSALELVDIRLLDHLVIGDGYATSMASRGML